eukprot:gene17599-biopygen1720
MQPAPHTHTHTHTHGVAAREEGGPPVPCVRARGPEMGASLRRAPPRRRRGGRHATPRQTECMPEEALPACVRMAWREGGAEMPALVDWGGGGIVIAAPLRRRAARHPDATHWSAPRARYHQRQWIREICSELLAYENPPAISRSSPRDFPPQGIRRHCPAAPAAAAAAAAGGAPAAARRARGRRAGGAARGRRSLPFPKKRGVAGRSPGGLRVPGCGGGGTVGSMHAIPGSGDRSRRRLPGTGCGGQRGPGGSGGAPRRLDAAPRRGPRRGMSRFGRSNPAGAGEELPLCCAATLCCSCAAAFLPLLCRYSAATPAATPAATAAATAAATYAAATTTMVV